MFSFVLLAFELHLGTALLVLGAVSLAIAAAFASQSMRYENHRTEKDLGLRRGRAVDTRRHKTPPPIHRTVVLLPDGSTRGKKVKPPVKANPAKPAVPNKPPAEEPVTAQQVALAADLSSLNEAYDRGGSFDKAAVRRALHLAEQLADTEPNRMIALLRKWLND